MKIHLDHLQAIERLLPKHKRQAFIDQAIESALKQIKPQKSSQKAKEDEVLKIFTDGGSRGNPGPSGGGFVVYKKGKLVLSGSEFFGEKTNNQAEYLALRLALRQVYARFGDGPVDCFLDSQLAVEQVSGNYKVKSPNVKPLYEEVMRIAAQFKAFSIRHVPREQNAEADLLANEAMNKRS